MKQLLEITLSNYYTKKDLQELEGFRFGKYSVKANRLPKPKENTGGFTWEGVIMFMVASVAAGFLSELGKDSYIAFKEKLFTLKDRLQRGNVYKFTVNVKFNNSIVFFHLTDLDKENFIEGLDTLGEFITEETSYIENNGGFYDAVFNRELKKWQLDRNTIFDI